MANWLDQVAGHAQTASQQLKIPASVILAQWYHETGGGTSNLAKNHNNLAGIKKTSLGKDYTAGGYAGYKSLASFTKDYVRVMRLSYYDKVRAAGEQGKPIGEVIKALAASPWAESGYYGGQALQVLIRQFNLEKYDHGFSGGLVSAVPKIIDVPKMMPEVPPLKVMQGGSQINISADGEPGGLGKLWPLALIAAGMYALGVVLGD